MKRPIPIDLGGKKGSEKTLIDIYQKISHLHIDSVISFLLFDISLDFFGGSACKLLALASSGWSDISHRFVG